MTKFCNSPNLIFKTRIDLSGQIQAFKPMGGFLYRFNMALNVFSDYGSDNAKLYLYDDIVIVKEFLNWYQFGHSSISGQYIYSGIWNGGYLWNLSQKNRWHKHFQSKLNLKMDYKKPGYQFLAYSGNHFQWNNGFTKKSLKFPRGEKLVNILGKTK